MSPKQLNATKKLAIYRKVWTPERSQKREAYRVAGDEAAVVRIDFGAYVKAQRLECGLSQAKAGTKLRDLRVLEEARKGNKTRKPNPVRKCQQQEPNREREQWNAWEQGVHLPEDVNICRIATVLDGDPATFLRHARRPVPSYLLVHDEAWATRTFLRALYKAKSCVEFLDAAQAIWQEYVFQQTHLRPHLRIDRAYSQVLEMVRLYLDEKQQVQLAGTSSGIRTTTSSRSTSTRRWNFVRRSKRDSGLWSQPNCRRS